MREGAKINRKPEPQPTPPPPPEKPIPSPSMRPIDYRTGQPERLAPPKDDGADEALARAIFVALVAIYLRGVGPDWKTRGSLDYPDMIAASKDAAEQWAKRQ